MPIFQQVKQIYIKKDKYMVNQLILEQDKKKAEYLIHLGKVLEELEQDTNFKILIEYFENKFKDISMQWAIHNKEYLMKDMQALLVVKSMLAEIKEIAIQSVNDLQSIKEFEEINRKKGY